MMPDSIETATIRCEERRRAIRDSTVIRSRIRSQSAKVKKLSESAPTKIKAIKARV